MSPPDREPRRRVWTKEQQERKRLVDRKKQKSNRQEAKTRMETIQSGIENIQQTLELLSSQVQAAYPPITAPIPVPIPPQPQDVLSSIPEFDGQLPLSSPTPTPTSHENALACVDDFQAGYSLQAKMWSVSAPLHFPHMNLQVPSFQCRCGITHAKTTECMERQAFNILYERRALQFEALQLSRPPLPRNPPLPGWSASEDSSIEYSLASILRGYNFQSTETLFGCYFFAYRFLRWRLCLTADSFADLPPWLVPTPTQNTWLHPLSIDFIPWAGIRDYLCLNQNQDYRQVSKIYVESLHLDCPKTCSVFGFEPGRQGQVSISDEFADIASNLKNWSLGSPFRETFPQLVKYLL